MGGFILGDLVSGRELGGIGQRPQHSVNSRMPGAPSPRTLPAVIRSPRPARPTRPVPILTGVAGPIRVTAVPASSVRVIVSPDSSVRVAIGPASSVGVIVGPASSVRVTVGPDRPVRVAVGGVTPLAWFGGPIVATGM